jgi:signal peptidase I
VGVPLGVAAGWVPVAAHDPAMVLVAAVWLASVLCGGALAHQRPARTGRGGWGVPVLVALAYVAAIRAPALLTGRVVHRYEVAGISMQPSLKVGEDLLVRRAIGEVHVGDVVLYDPNPAHTAQPWVKRVVAVAGQTVSIRGGAVVVDGAPVATDAPRTETLAVDARCADPEPVLVQDERHGDRRATVRVAPDGALAEVRVPADHVFVLGDNRPASMDSRRHGAIPLAQVRGVVLGVALPWSSCGLDLSGLGRVP